MQRVSVEVLVIGDAPRLGERVLDHEGDDPIGGGDLNAAHPSVFVIPQEFEQLPPQMVNLMFKIPCHMRVGGIRVSYPKSIVALDGAAG